MKIASPFTQLLRRIKVYSRTQKSNRNHLRRLMVEQMEDRRVFATIDLAALTAAQGTTIFGADLQDFSGWSVSTAGDVNGDGYDDVIIGAYGADGVGNAKSTSGESYLIFGSLALPATLDLASLGSRGVTIFGADSTDNSGRSVSSAGDVNGDGFDDLLIGADKGDASENAKLNAGESYIVFGGSTLPATLNLGSLGTAGVTILGADSFDYSGWSVSAAGDVNGDGFDDLVIGARWADGAGNAKPFAGESYVIFGGEVLPATIDLASLGSVGVTIFGAENADNSGRSVSGAGDVNGDGFDDLIIGAHFADGSGNTKANAGDSYLIYGKASLPATIDLANLGTAGVTLYGAVTNNYSSYSVSGAGDLNGDGFDDLVIGAILFASNSISYSGRSYVIFGGPSLAGTIELSTVGIGTSGFTISGIDTRDNAGSSVSNAGDVNGDGFDDLFVGARFADGSSNFRIDAGEGYVIFGKSSFPSNVNLSSLGADGITIFGAGSNDGLGRSVSNAGDVNGDGFDDLILGARYADASGNLKDRAGDSYIVFGSNFTSSITHQGTIAGETLTGTSNPDFMNGARGDDILIGNGGADVLTGGQGNDVLAVSNLAFKRVIGGTGIDTLQLDGSGLSLDLSSFADNRLLGIEQIDITGSGNNVLRLNQREVLYLSDESNTLTVLRNAGDVVFMGSGWTQGADETIGLNSFKVFTQGSARLKVQIRDQAPTDLSISSSSVVENIALGTAIGNIITADPDPGDFFSYSLVPGAGDTDNAAFSLNGSQLTTNVALDYEAKNSYSIRVRVMDTGGLTFEKALNINVSNVDESPVLSRLLENVDGNAASTVGNSGTWSDPDSNNVTLSSSIGTVVKNANGTWDWSYVLPVVVVNQLVTVTANDGTNSFSVSFLVNKELASADTFVENHWGNTSDRPAIVQPVRPVEPTQDATGKWTYDFRVDTPFDQSVTLKPKKVDAAAHRILIDPNRSYQIGGLLAPDTEQSVVVKVLDGNGVLIDSLYLVLQSYELPDSGLSERRIIKGRAVIGAAGTPILFNAAAIEFATSVAQQSFGFLSDETQRVQQATWSLLDEVVSAKSLDARLADQQIPIDGSSAYVFDFGGARVDGTSSTQLHSAGITALDIDKRVISGVHVERFLSAIDTTLAVALNPGDTSFLLTNADGWSNRSSDPRTRALAWYGYRNSRGELYPDYTYTRNVASDPIDGVWSVGSVNGNRITLNKPWAGPAIAAGTAIRNAVDSGTFLPVALDRGTLTSSSSSDLQGYWQQGGRSLRAFPPGTVWAQPTVVLNQSSVASDENVRVSFRYWQKGTVWEPVTGATNPRTVQLDVLANDRLGVRSTTKILSVTQPEFGTVSIVSGVGGAADKVQYTGSNYFVGTDRFEYQILDSVTGKSASAEVKVQFVGGNLDADVPLQTRVSSNTSPLGGEGFVAGFDVAAGQVLNGNGQTNLKIVNLSSNNNFAILHSAPSFGSLQLNPDGTFQYKPNPGFVGLDYFTIYESTSVERRLRMVGITVAEDAGALDALRMRTLGIANYNFESLYRQFFYPDRTVVPSEFDANFRPYLSWRVRMLPYFGFSTLYSRFRLNEPWDSPNNLPLLAEMPDVFRSAGDTSSTTNTRYQVLANTVAPNPLELFLNEQDSRQNRTRISNVTDGVANTIAIVQSGADKSVPWTKPDELDYNMADPISSLGNVGTFVNALFLGSERGTDSLVRQIPLSVGNTAFQSMATLTESVGATFDVPSAARGWRSIPGVRAIDGLYEDSGMQSRLKNIAFAMVNHESAFRTFAPAATVPKDANGFPYLSWRVYILPYLGYSNLYSQFRLDEPWDSPNNLPLQNAMPEVFRSIGDSHTSSSTRIRVLGGLGMAYKNFNSQKAGPRFADFVDGWDSMMFVEAGVDKSVGWTQPDILVIDPANVMASLGSFPSGEVRYANADGSVGKLSLSMPLDAFVSRMTISSDSVRVPRSPYEAFGIDPILGPMGGLATNDGNNMKQLVVAQHNYESAFRRFPRNVKGGTGTQLLSWRVEILPYIGESLLYDKFRFNEPWDSPYNLTLLPAMPTLFRSANDTSTSTTTRFQMFDGVGTLNPSGTTNLGFSAITDGSSNTAMLVRTGPDSAVPWTKPDDVDFSSTKLWEFLGNIGSRTLFAKADGSVGTRLSPSIGNSYLAAFATIAGGEVLSTVTDPNKSVLYVREGGVLDFIDSTATTITVDDPSLATFSKVGNRVTVGTPDNTIVDGTRRTKIRLNGVAVDVIVFDDDSHAIVPLSSSPVRVTELGESVDHWVRLNSPITSDVTIQAASNNTSEMIVSNATLTFTAANWSVPQHITVQGVADSVLDGDIASLIQWQVVSTGDVNYPIGMKATSQSLTLDNRPSTNLRLSGILDALPEDANTTNPTSLANILFDDDFGNNTISLSGPDASSFVLVGSSLQLKAGVVLDFESKSQYQVTIAVDDAAVGATPDQSMTFVLSITNVNKAPVLTRSQANVTGNVLSTLSNSGTWSDPEGNTVTLTASLGTVVKNANGTWDWSYTPTEKLVNQAVTITANDGTNTSTVSFAIDAIVVISQRGLFYSGATGSSASTSLATDKSPLLPGQASTYANYTNYSRGLNGLVIDIAGLPATTTNAQMLASLQFAQWNGLGAVNFAALPGTAIPTVTILSAGGVGGSARVRISFPDNTVQNTWLQVRVVANADTGLAANDVFYFGNVIGDLNIGNTATRLRVNGQDTGLMLLNQSAGINSASVTNLFDLNRDGRVNGLDTGILQANQQAAGIVAPITAPSSLQRPARGRVVGEGEASPANSQMPSIASTAQFIPQRSSNSLVGTIVPRWTRENYDVLYASSVYQDVRLPQDNPSTKQKAILPDANAKKKRLDSEMQFSQLDDFFARFGVV